MVSWSAASACSAQCCACLPPSTHSIDAVIHSSIDLVALLSCGHPRPRLICVKAVRDIASALSFLPLSSALNSALLCLCCAMGMPGVLRRVAFWQPCPWRLVCILPGTFLKKAPSPIGWLKAWSYLSSGVRPPWKTVLRHRICKTLLGTILTAAFKTFVIFSGKSIFPFLKTC